MRGPAILCPGQRRVSSSRHGSGSGSSRVFFVSPASANVARHCGTGVRARASRLAFSASGLRGDSPGRSAAAVAGPLCFGTRELPWLLRLVRSMWLWVKTNGIPFWLVGAPPILEPILVVGLGCSLGVRALDFDHHSHVSIAQWRQAKIREQVREVMRRPQLLDAMDVAR